MKISELEESDRLKALEYQKLYPNSDNESGLDSVNSFSWNFTNEGKYYWRKLHKAIFIDNDEKTNDTIVLSVMNDLNARSLVGIEKYGVTLDRTDLSRKDWLTHAYEETLDKALYLKKLISLENE